MDVGFWIAVAAIVLGAVLYLIEVLNPGFFLAIPGTVLLVTGVLGTLWPSLIWSTWSLLVLPASAAVATAGTVVAYRKFAPPDLRPLTLAADSLVGCTGTIKRAIPPDGSGTARIQGQDWRAKSDRPQPVGTAVRVIRVDGLSVVVEPATDPEIPEP